MTKRDYIKIAAAINTEQASHGEHSSERLAVRDVALQLCIVFHGENIRFDQKTFLTACGF